MGEDLNHGEILRNYVRTDSDLRDYILGNQVTLNGFKSLDFLHAKAVRQYIKSLKEQGYSVPNGMEEIDKRNAERYGDLEI